MIGLIFLGVMSRVIPHAPNFTPVGATALFAGALLKPKWISFAIPMMVLWLSDLFLNNVVYKNQFPPIYSGWSWMGDLFVYIGFVTIVLIGNWIIRKIRFRQLFIASLLASVSFYLITNFGVWYHSTVWPQNLNGLLACYAFALPFFMNTIAADLLFTGILFGIYSYYQIRVKQLA